MTKCLQKPRIYYLLIISAPLTYIETPPCSIPSSSSYMVFLDNSFSSRFSFVDVTVKIAAIGEGGAHVFAWGSCHACLAPTFSALDVFAENIPSY